jgi:NAD(P)-dependent dehydrogenase (short-subunit alcohol dehydrogenase family)
MICAGFCQFKAFDHFVGANRERIKKLTRFKRVGVPQDIIGIVIFLASEESAYMTGQTVVVDEGVV